MLIYLKGVLFLKNKLKLLFFTVLFVLLVFFSSSVYAVNVAYTTFEGQDLENIKKYISSTFSEDDFVYCCRQDDGLLFVGLPSSVKDSVYIENFGSHGILHFEECSVNYHGGHFDESCNWVELYGGIETRSTSYLNETSTDFYCNSIVYDDSSLSTYFFHIAPLVTAVMRSSMGLTMAEIVGILPLILVAVVSFLGLRKGLALLLNFFRRA